MAQTISLFGDFVAAVQGLVVFRMHGSAREATGVLLASLIPAVALGPVVDFCGPLGSAGHAAARLFITVKCGIWRCKRAQ